MINHRSRLLVLFISLFLVAQIVTAQEIPKPEEYFGHQMGEEGILLDYAKSLEYYREIASLSPRIKMLELGKTTEGNPFTLLIISSAENITRLEELKNDRERLSDPRKISPVEAKELAERLPAVVFHTTSIHSSEISTAQVVPELVYNLVSGTNSDMTSIREKAIVLICPSANPDGQIKYNKWYSQHKGTAWEGRMPWLYHSYVGHDNNRDWVNLYFPEQRLTATRIHLEWHPVYSHEMHEFGSTAARIFLPPYLDPIDINTAPSVVSTMNSLGMAASHAMANEGKGGVVNNAHFDLFTPARAFQIYHGTGRILTETASGQFARTKTVTSEDFSSRSWSGEGYHPLKRSWNFPLPWQPGPWTFRDRVEYQLSASIALMRQAASNSYLYNMAFYNALKWAVDAEGWPYAYIIPDLQNSPEAARQLVKLLMQGGVEIHSLTNKMEINGRIYQPGSKVIYLSQPYGAWAKTLLEVQHYPDLRRNPDDPPVMPYDVTGHTLPLLMGVDAVKVAGTFEAEVELLKSADGEIDIKRGKLKYYAISSRDNSAFYMVNKLIGKNKKVWRLKDKVEKLDAGSFIVEATQVDEELIREIMGGRIVEVETASIKDIEKSTTRIRRPRVAVYESWGGVIDAGWSRKVLEDYGFEYSILRNSEIAAGQLNSKYDVIIFPDGFSVTGLKNGNRNYPEPYSEAAGTRGVANLKDFVFQGGLVLSWGSSSITVAQLLDLPVRDKAVELERNKFFAPGSVVLVELDTSHPVNYGMQRKTAVQIRRGPLFVPRATVLPGPKTPGRYPEYDCRLSGFLLGSDLMQGAGALAVQPMGKGKVVLFSYLPQFRGMTHGTFKQIFNALYWSLEK